MPLPKRRHSSTRQAKRRTHYKLDPPSIATCKECNSPRLSHMICPTCGNYNGRTWYTTKTMKAAAADAS